MNEPAITEVVRNSTQTVLDAVRDLHAQEQQATREAISDATGLKLSVIDDRTRALVDDGQMLRLKRGVFVPITKHAAARPMSKTILPDGTVKIEIGDDVLTLTPRESRILGELTAGGFAMLTAIESSRQASIVHAELARRLIALERENKALLRNREKKDGPQLDLLQQVVGDAGVYEFCTVVG